MPRYVFYVCNKEGGVRVYGDAVVRYFWCGFAEIVIFILAPQKVAEEETKIIANYAFLQPRSQGGDESEAAFVIFCLKLQMCI